MSDDTKLVEAGGRPKTRTWLKSASTDDGKLELVGGAESQATVAEALGTDCGEFKAYCLMQLSTIMSRAGTTDCTIELNAALAMLTAIDPKDELEAMLAVQMVATNHLALGSLRRCDGADTIDRRRLHGELANKFARTFTAQLDRRALEQRLKLW